MFQFLTIFTLVWTLTHIISISSEELLFKKTNEKLKDYDDQIDAYIALKYEEIHNFEHTPHPIEFEMYYSC